MFEGCVFGLSLGLGFGYVVLICFVMFDFGEGCI